MITEPTRSGLEVALLKVTAYILLAALVAWTLTQLGRAAAHVADLMMPDSLPSAAEHGVGVIPWLGVLALGVWAGIGRGRAIQRVADSIRFFRSRAR